MVLLYFPFLFGRNYICRKRDTDGVSFDLSNIRARYTFLSSLSLHMPVYIPALVVPPLSTLRPVRAGAESLVTAPGRAGLARLGRSRGETPGLYPGELRDLRVRLCGYNDGLYPRQSK